MMKKFVVGEPFPEGLVPNTEGAVCEIDDQGTLNLFLQFPDLRLEEENAFKKSFNTYSYLEIQSKAYPAIPMPMLFFHFLKPVGTIETVFDARSGEEGRLGSISKFLDNSDGVNNSIMIYLLDMNILKGIKMIGLHHEMIFELQKTLRKQLQIDYTFDEYLESLDSLFEKPVRYYSDHPHARRFEF